MLFNVLALDMPQVYVIPTTLNTLLQIVVTIILFLVLRHFLFKPMTAFMEKRSNTVSNELEEAKKQNQAALDLKQSYEKKLAEAKNEALNIVEEGRKRGHEIQDEIVSEAKEKADALLHRAKEEVAREKEKAKDEMKQEIVHLSVAMASKIIEKEMDKASHEKMIHQFIDELGEQKWQN